MGYMIKKMVEPSVIDVSLDFIDSTAFMRDDADHQVLIPEDQILVLEDVNGYIKTVLKSTF